MNIQHPGAETLAAAAHGALRQQLAARYRHAPARPRPPDPRRKSSSTFCTRASWGRSGFALEGGEAALAILDETLERAAGCERARGGRSGWPTAAGSTCWPISFISRWPRFSPSSKGEIDPASTQGSGDVKYHLGAAGVHQSSSGAEMAVSVSPNPSHLEAVDPVVEGIVRPKQDHDCGDTERARVIPLLVHGDAAFAGQGVVVGDPEPLATGRLLHRRHGPPGDQ